MPIGPVTTLDTFTRQLDGDWGYTDNSSQTSNRNRWDGETNSRWDVNESSSFAQIDVFSDFPSYDVAYINLANEGVPYTKHQQTLVKVKWDGTPTPLPTDHGPALMVVDPDNYWYVSIRQSEGKVGLRQVRNGTVEYWPDTNVSLLRNTWYWVRFDQNLMTFSCKIWKASVHEPSAWTFSIYTASVLESFRCKNWGYSARNTGTNHSVTIDTFYGWTLSEDAQSASVNETFSRVVNGGWGKTDSGHAWEGVVASHPEVYLQDSQGSVTTVGGVGGRISTGFIGEQTAWINTTRGGDVNAYLEFTTNSGSTNSELFVGLCGNVRHNGGRVEYQGYGFKIVRNATNFTVHTKTSYGGAWSAPLGQSSATAFTAIGTNIVYRVRVAKIGNQLYARLWTGATEPSTWNFITVTDTTFTSGVPFIVINQLDATLRNYDFHFYQFDAYVPAGTLHTVTGTFSSTGATATTYPFDVGYTNDSPANNSVAIAYRKSADSDWITFTGTLTRGTQKWSGTLTGLSKNTTYIIRATFTDADGVVGLNPVYATFTTTTNGIVVGNPIASNIAQTTVTVTVPYEDDTNANSTASLRYRTTTTLATAVGDSFTGTSGTDLAGHIPDGGGASAWVRHVSSLGAETVDIWRDQIYYHSLGTLDNYAIYYNPSYTGADYTVTASIYAAGLNGRAAVIGRASTSAATFYAAEYQMEEQALVLYKSVAGVQTPLSTVVYSVAQYDSVTVDLVMEGTALTVYADGVQVMTATDSSIASGYSGVKFTNKTADVGSNVNQLNMDNFFLTYRLPAGSWTTSGAMTADRVAKTFTRNVTGLTAGTAYEFNAVVTDADGVFGAVNGSVVVQMKGLQISPISVVVSPSQTTALVDVFYGFDTNNNSTVDIQYKSILDRQWRTVSPTQIRVNRTTKYFETSLAGLRPGISYTVVAEFTDPDGISEGAPSRIEQTFATTTYLDSDEKRRKYYLYKVYDHTDKYITTWEDAEIPEFSSYENGGVSDLRIKLPRKISQLNDPRSGIGFQNRVDVWEIDPSSDGFGVNRVDNPTFEPALGGWLPQAGSEANAILGSDYGPGDGSGLKISSADGTQYVIRSNYIKLYPSSQSLRGANATSTAIPVPLVVMCMARGAGAKLILDVEAYAADENVLIGTSADLGMTVGHEWQVVRLEFVPPQGAESIRVALRNEGKGNVYAGNVSVRPKEALVYRGHIETFTPQIDDDGESIDIEVLGLVSLLSDDYIDFLQYVESSLQPQNDFDAGLPRNDPSDPAVMLRDIIDLARAQNPRCSLYYTEDSIQNTGQPMRYTFRNRQLRGCFDKVRELCPSGWHYYIAPDGLVYLRDSATAPTHRLRLGVEVLKFSAERSIRNLKNYVVVKGRQDEDRTEHGTYGSIREVAFDSDSIKRYGKRVVQINDAQIIDPSTAELVAAGRLEEHNHEEQQVMCTVIDEKVLEGATESLRGYNIESFRPGDNVIFYDPLSGPAQTYWNQFDWDVGFWDYGEDFQPLTDSVPIKRIQFQGDYVTLELSERQPSSVGDFGRMYRVLQLRSEETGE